MSTSLSVRLWTSAAITAALVIATAFAVLQFAPRSWFEIGLEARPSTFSDAQRAGPRANRGQGMRPSLALDARTAAILRRRHLIETLAIALLVTVGVGACAHQVLRRTRVRLTRLQSDLKQIVDGDHVHRSIVDSDDEIGQMAREVNRAADHFRRLSSSHQSLLAHSSHELRSPLTRTRLALELLLDQYDGLESNTRFREVRRNIAEIEQLIDEILTSSTLDSSPSILNADEPINLDAICEQETARVKTTFDRSARPHSGEPIRATVDPVLFRRLLRNLLENAEKYGDGQPIRLTLDTDGPSHLLLKVSDQGIGVPENERERIFEPFYRRRGASESRGGVGLGLALVRQIATLHQGRVWCEANSPHGSVFVCRLPTSLSI